MTSLLGFLLFASGDTLQNSHVSYLTVVVYCRYMCFCAYTEIQVFNGEIYTVHECMIVVVMPISTELSQVKAVEQYDHSKIQSTELF